MNDRRICDQNFDQRRKVLCPMETERRDRNSHARCGHRIFKLEEKYKGATMNKAAMFRNLIIVIAGMCTVLPAVASQASAKPAASLVTITGQVSCSKFVGPVTP